MQVPLLITALLSSVILADYTPPPSNPINDHCTNDICNCPAIGDPNLSVVEYCDAYGGNVGDCGPSGNGPCETCRFPTIDSFRKRMNCLVDKATDKTAPKTWRQSGASVGACCYLPDPDGVHADVACNVECGGKPCPFTPDGFGLCGGSGTSPGPSPGASGPSPGPSPGPGQKHKHHRKHPKGSQPPPRG